MVMIGSEYGSRETAYIQKLRKALYRECALAAFIRKTPLHRSYPGVDKSAERIKRAYSLKAALSEQFFAYGLRAFSVP